MPKISLKKVLLSILLFTLSASVFSTDTNVKALVPHSDTAIPAEIKTIMNKPMYKNATWSLRVTDRDTGKELLSLNSDNQLFIGSVRKLFSVGELLNALGPEYRSETTVHKDGEIQNGTLKGNLVLVASGDLTMGGRTLPNGDIAFTDFDHNEANTLGNAILTKPNPLAGYQQLAKQIKDSGINAIDGDVIIDDRLFEAFNFRNEFDVTPIFVNDDVVDVIINPGNIQENAEIDWRPKSSALNVINNLNTVSSSQKYTLQMAPAIPLCIGKADCYGTIKGDLPQKFSPPLTNAFPLIQTFRITKPSNYARTLLIELLDKEGVDVSKVTKIKNNPTTLLKESRFYSNVNQIAQLKSLSYLEHAKFILKVSYNIGADTSLMLLGLTKGAHTMADSLLVEQKLLQEHYGVSPTNYHFIDGSGGGDTTASSRVLTKWLEIMAQKPISQQFTHALPILAVDGSLGFVNHFQKDPTLAGAAGNVFAKTGTYVLNEKSGMMIKGQAFAGYIKSKNNRHLAFDIIVNAVPMNSLDTLLDVFQDQGTISALLWRDL
ncbi:D-alanyl-D-alanine carboxypeptidase/D-alanyl-D-alanine-endopeptidase [uncultured Legionella sp.]|uniref:D-alanyl-D-alanine carboxypeptidase/D-alanyl-D-alanine-endopeptidase n=1 Tax=uncultured Legionella sp. TaxID=210934 RepID=UPI00260FE1F5|nr:D-alanyl-D-alanine carboxypeptidase [uncultured Legionella sp.]